MGYLKYQAMKEKNCLEISIKHLFVLCDTIEDYKPFIDDLNKVVKSKNGRDLSFKVYKKMMNKKFLNSKKYQDIIKKHQETINIMKKYSFLENFVVDSYEKGERIFNKEEEYFYRYILEHKNDIEKIKKVLTKLENLGFNDIIFGEHLNFKGIEHQLDTYSASDFEYLENIKIIPSFSNDSIKYETDDSCYCMYLKAIFFKDGDMIKPVKYIELNTLVFDVNRLPDNLESTTEEIRKSALDKRNESEIVKDIVGFSIVTDDLNTKFEYLKQYVSKNKQRKDDEKLSEILFKIKDALIDLKTYENVIKTEAVKSNENITSENIEKEKKLYLERRFWSGIDID